MKKILLYGAAALVLSSLVACSTDNTPKTANGKAEITVAKDALVAYFPMEDATEQVSNLNCAHTSTSFVEGRTGKCFQGGTNDYLLYDVNADIKAMKGYTLSMWIKQAEIDSDHAPVPMYFQVTRDDDLYWGCFSMCIDRTEKGAGYLTYKSCWYHDAAGSIWKTWNEKYADCFPAGRWNHIIYSYDATTSEYHVYCNGTDVTPEDAVACTWGETAAPAGANDWSSAKQINFGAWMPKLINGATDEWMGDLNNESQIDEVRLFNRGLTAVEAKALYAAEVANIND